MSPHQDKIDTIYFGGGTPSLLSLAQVEQILSAVRNHFSILENPEVTVEANPDSIDYDYATGLVSLGVNRVSIGIQSFDDTMLSRVGRLHTAAQGRKAVEAVFQGGIDNISIDLIYGLPGYNMPVLQHDLAVLGSLPVTHASIYSLIVEEHTMLWDAYRKNRIELPDEDEMTRFAETIWQRMAELGFVHYEISSYCRPGRLSKHNSKYWQYEPYLGFGASAHSFYGNVRYANLRNIHDYMRNAGKQSVVAEQVVISRKRAMEDYCFLALRMKQGIIYKEFNKYFNICITEEFGKIIRELQEKGLLESNQDGCRLSKQGLLYGNYVFSQFIRDEA